MHTNASAGFRPAALRPSCCQRPATRSQAPWPQQAHAASLGQSSRAAAASPPLAMCASTPTATWTVDDMLSSLRNAQRFDPQAAAAWDQHEAATAVNLAKQTLMGLGYSQPLRSGVRDSFCEEGGLQEVLQLLPHPELQYLAMSALVALLGAWQGDCAADAAAAAEQLGVAEALLPLLAPGTSWVIQGRCCGVLTLLIRQELRKHDPGQDHLRQGVRWQLLHGGGITSLTSLLHGPNKEAKHQASTTLAMLSRFGTQYRAALLLETGLLVSLVDRCAESPHNVALDVACAVVNLCDTDSAPLQQQVIAAGAVQALMQMQSLAYTGPFREAARKRLRALAATQPAARRQILEIANVVQPAETQPAEWTAWWRQLRADVGLA